MAVPEVIRPLRTGNRFRSETVKKIYNSFTRGSYVTALAVGKKQRLYSGVGMFIWFYISSF
jgi:hypothetical protein